MVKEKKSQNNKLRSLTDTLVVVAITVWTIGWAYIAAHDSAVFRRFQADSPIFSSTTWMILVVSAPVVLASFWLIYKGFKLRLKIKSESLSKLLKIIAVSILSLILALFMYGIFFFFTSFFYLNN